MRSGPMVWMAPSARPHCAVSAARASAHSSSRRILRGMVSPSRRCTTSQAAPSAPGSPMATTAGTGTPAARAASNRSRSARVLTAPWAGSWPRSICRMSGVVAPSVSRSKALVTREAPPERRRRARTRPPSCAPSAAASSSPLSLGATSAPLLDGDDRPPGVVELVQVLADAVAGAGDAVGVVVGPAGQALVDHGAAGPPDVRHPPHVTAQLVGAALLVDHVEVHHAVRHPVVGQFGPDLPLGHRRSRRAVPHPAPVQIPGVGPETDAAEVHVLAHVDGEPAPHLGAAPAARAPGAVTVPVGAAPFVAHAVDGERARPAAGLLEMALAHRPRRRGRLGRLGAAAPPAVGG